jgi:hypothetical protein
VVSALVLAAIERERGEARDSGLSKGSHRFSSFFSFELSAEKEKRERLGAPPVSEIKESGAQLSY